MLSSFLPPTMTLTEHKDLVISRQRDTRTQRRRERERLGERDRERERERERARGGLSDSINTDL